MDIFLSRPTYIDPSFEEGLKNFSKQLEKMNLKPRTLGSTDYPLHSPLDEVLKIMNECSGIIILGYPQIIIKQGFLKNNKIIEDMILGTEWNHIEAALAYSKQIPMIVIHHEGLSRGIFERGTLNSYIYSKNLKNPSWFFDEAISGALDYWKASLEHGHTANSVNKKVTFNKELNVYVDDIGNMLCPGCYDSNNKLIRVVTEGGSMNKCPVCKTEYFDSCKSQKFIAQCKEHNRKAAEKWRF